MAANTEFRVFRNGQLYDRLDSRTHAVEQVVRSWALDMPNDSWKLVDSSGETTLELTPQVVKKPREPGW